MSRSDGAFARMSDSDLTGSIGPPQAQGPTDSDLAFARDAASDVLTKGDKDSSQPWENAKTGARGSVTPLAKAYPGDDGRICRDFLASYVNGETESWLQGGGLPDGRWALGYSYPQAMAARLKRVAKIQRKPHMKSKRASGP